MSANAAVLLDEDTTELEPAPAPTRFPLSAKQHELYDAMSAFAHKGVPSSKFVLSGLAGTGKTTVVTRLIEDLHNSAFRVGLAAPTGKAARVLMSKQSAVKACTLHRLFGAVPVTLTENEELEYEALTNKVMNGKPLTDEERERYLKLEKLVERLRKKVGFAEAKVEEVNDSYDIIIIDEASMIGVKSHGIDLGLSQLTVPTIFIGDPGQLPPVQDKPFVNWSKPDFHLSEIMRQASTNGIVPYSHAIYQGAFPGRDLLADVPNVEVLRNAAPRTILEAENDHQILVYRNVTRHQFNWAIREKRGIKGELYPHFPAVGEKLMCRKNAYDLGLFNGSVVTVKAVYPYNSFRDNLFLCMIDVIDDDGIERRKIPVSLADMCETITLYDDKAQQAARRETAKHRGTEFSWTYALTVHKAQGSEWDKVILVGETSPRTDEGRKWWYTGITRARQELLIASTEIK